MFEYTDPDGDRLTASPDVLVDGTPIVTLVAQDPMTLAIVHIPVDRVEEVVAGIRDTARTAAGQQPEAGCPAALLPFGTHLADPCVMRGFHVTHRSSTGRAWETEQPAAGQPATQQHIAVTRNAGQGILNYLTGRAVCSTPRPVEEATALLDAYRAEVLREAADAVDHIPTGDCSDANNYDEAWDWGAEAAATRLRRMADEAAQQPSEPDVILPPTTEVSYRLEHRYANESTWRKGKPGLGIRWTYADRTRADQRLTEAREQWPQYEHRMVTITTTVTEAVTADEAAQ